MVARFLLFIRLRRRMHPGVAYLVTLAVYPRRGPATVVPQVRPAEAHAIVKAWRREPDVPAERLLERLYGTEQDEVIETLLRRGEQER
ncbi:MAG: hypothetical protein JJT89_13955 [Nitriliruptoraceae bacterium]|nr:hypothetical protein [Nitriliruptoraceae bacterium]